MQQNPIDNIDVLRHVEKITETASGKMSKKSRGAFRRYPIMFTILVVFGIIAVDEGAKGILEEIGFANHPVYLLFTGLIILVLTGSLFKRLDKFHVEK